MTHRLNILKAICVILYFCCASDAQNVENHWCCKVVEVSYAQHVEQNKHIGFVRFLKHHMPNMLKHNWCYKVCGASEPQHVENNTLFL